MSFRLYIYIYICILNSHFIKSTRSPLSLIFSLSSISLPLPERAMEASVVQMEELTSGASNRIIPLFKNLHRSVLRSLIFIQSFFFWLFLLLRLRRRISPPPSPSSSAPTSSKRRFALRRDEEDTLRRRALAEGIRMVTEEDTGDRTGRCEWSTSLFFGARSNALFCRSWFPVDGEIKYGL